MRRKKSETKREDTNATLREQTKMDTVLTRLLSLAHLIRG